MINATATFTFTGTGFTVIYTSGFSYGNLQVYVDGVLLGTINEKTTTTGYQRRWDYPGTLAAGSHQLKLVFSGPGGSRASLDALIVKSVQ